MKTFITLSAAGASLLAATAMILPQKADACTRVTFVGDSGIVITGRTLDWRTPIPTNLYVMPRGIARQSYNKPEQSISWTSKYGSVVAVSYDCGVSEGLNEKGLACNLLYLPGTYYAKEGDTRPYMSTALWASYVLDNFATTSEAVQQLKLNQFQINAPAMPGGSATTLHMAICDNTGYSAIIEYIDGEMRIHEGYQYQVMTNAPAYDKQLAINEYWQAVGGQAMLPGTNRSQDRFVRASYYVGVIPKNSSHNEALAGVFGIIGNCAVPTGITTPDQPEISTTQWRSVSDQLDITYYFHPTSAPAIFWLKLREFDLYPGAPIMKLDVINAKEPLMGNCIKKCKPSKGFSPLYEMTPELAKKLMGEA